MTIRALVEAAEEAEAEAEAEAAACYRDLFVRGIRRQVVSPFTNAISGHG